MPFHDWAGYTKYPLDFTDGSYTHLRISYRGLTQGQTLRAQLSYNYMRREANFALTEQSKAGALVDIGTYSADYKTVDIPIQSLIKSNPAMADMK